MRGKLLFIWTHPKTLVFPIVAAVIHTFAEFTPLAFHMDIGKKMVPMVLPQMMSHNFL